MPRDNQHRSRPGIILVLSGLLLTCGGDRNITVHFGVDSCRTCNMLIDNPREAAVLVMGTEIRPFCNPVCMLQDINRAKPVPLKPSRVLVSDYGSGTLTEVETATFVRGSFPTVMNSGVVAFIRTEEADSFAAGVQGQTLDYRGFRVALEDPDHNLRIPADAAGGEPVKILVEKNDLVLLTIEGLPEGDHTVVIRGYEQVVPQPGHPAGVILKFVAHQPGMGFPVELQPSRRLIGQLVVQGAHTAEEEL